MPKPLRLPKRPKARRGLDLAICAAMAFALANIIGAASAIF